MIPDLRMGGLNHALQSSPDGKLVAMSDSVDVSIIEVESGKEVHTIKTNGMIGSAAAIDLSADGQMLAYVIMPSQKGPNPPVLVDVNSGKVVATLGEMTKAPEKKVRKPKPKPGQPVVPAMQEMPVGAVAFSPDGKTLATSTMLGGDIDLWDNPLSAAPATPGPSPGETKKP